MKRIDFLKFNIAAGVYLSMPLYFGCNPEESKLISNKELEILKNVHKILFPDYKTTPTIDQIHTDKFIVFILEDSFYDEDQKQYLKNGIKWLNEFANEEYDSDYLDLNPSIQSEIISKITKKSWGESWLSYNLTLIFEALLSDPLYGFNTNEIGWKWLSHQSGQPRATNKTMYPQIFKSI